MGSPIKSVSGDFRDKVHRMKEGKTFLEYLASGKPIIGDGSYVFTLEKRGYVKGGAWTPEAVIQYPEAVKQLHKEYLRAGCDIIQAFSFYASDGKLDHTETGKSFTCEEINQAACDLAIEVAGDDKAFICGGVSPTPTFKGGQGDKEQVKAEFRKQFDIFSRNKTDFLLGEFFAHVAEAELAIEAMKDLELPIAITLRMGPTGDHDDVSPGDVAVRLAKAGADVIGLNCSYDTDTCLETIAMMKEGLKKAGLSPFLMVQPVGYMCPDVRTAKDGYHELPEFPFAIESRIITRYDARRFARKAYELGVSYIGGCCGIEPYHIREMAEELAEERGRRPPGKDKYESFGQAMQQSTWMYLTKRIGRDYWMNLTPGTGRPGSAAHTWAEIPKE